jgi:hypothetical protein
MTIFRKFEVCASYEHLWLNRHLRQAANRSAKQSIKNKKNEKTDFFRCD